MNTMSGPVRLADLAADGKLLWLYCRDCGREREIEPDSLPLPATFPVPHVGSRMKCSACGSRKISSAPQLGELTIEQSRQRRRDLGEPV